ncbi:HNH endonuclease [Bremerella cremea]|uniref:HNH endonuclease n=2 Tax=Bremerella cremea TaxID=1031537 RepID=A0A368KPM5_9BACT|nr:HNH endonuclease [Bremerella cremea]
MRLEIARRAGNCCEYCQMPQGYDPATFEVDHIIPEKMKGETSLPNLCLACFPCNNCKGPNIAGIDPETKQKTFLFDPRNEAWREHFVWDGPYLRGKTSVGRATVDLLQINLSFRIAFRRQLIVEGVFPPKHFP